MKAEGRVGVEGRIVRMTDNPDGQLDLEQERALGRLGEGLRRVREQRGLSQSEIASLAGVSASAISQAEGGQRGLALDTVLTLAESLDVPLDTLLATKTSSDYVAPSPRSRRRARGHRAVDRRSEGRAARLRREPRARASPARRRRRTRDPSSFSSRPGSSRWTSARRCPSCGSVTPCSRRAYRSSVGGISCRSRPSSIGSCATD